MIRRQNSGGKGMRGMVAAMIPGSRVDTKGRVSLNISTSNDTILFNIGGEQFETYRSTLYRQPNSPLADESFLKRHFRPDKGDYFFDRDPTIFRSMLNFLRTGELHIPSYICGPAAKTELKFWGMEAENIERCCWTNYKEWNSTLEALNQLEEDREGARLQENGPTTGLEEVSSARRWFNKAAQVLHAPDTSLVARVISFTSLLFVLLSIISFVAETTKSFETFQNVTVFQHSYTNNTDTLYTVQNITTKVTLSNETDIPLDVKSIAVKVVHPTLKIIDLVCLVFFTTEYIIKIILAPKRLLYVTSGLGVINLLAILPDFIEMIVYSARPELKIDYVVVNVLHALRVIRVLRIFRLILHVPGLWILVYTLKASIGELVLLVCFMSVGILVFSSLIYFAEDREHFNSIPDAFWWALITMTTVGYGDMYPVTDMGKVIGSLCALSGLLMVGFSVPMIVNNFTLYYKHVLFAMQSEREANTLKEKEQQGHNESTPSAYRRMDSHTSWRSSGQGNGGSEHVPLVSLTSSDSCGS